jgi:hypothetical protein
MANIWRVNSDKSKEESEMELKEILGEDLYNQVKEQLKGKGPQGKDIELVATNTGDYVPASKYESLKSDYSTLSTNYATLNSNYDKLNANKEKDIKKILVVNQLEKAEVIKVNESYNYLMPMIDIDKLSVENGNLVDNDNIIGGFIEKNPSLVAKTQSGTETPAPTNPSIPAGTGTNPPSPQSSVKDKAYYESAYKQATDIVERMSIKRQAGEQGIMI